MWPEMAGPSVNLSPNLQPLPVQLPPLVTSEGAQANIHKVNFQDFQEQNYTRTGSRTPARCGACKVTFPIKPGQQVWWKYKEWSLLNMPTS